MPLLKKYLLGEPSKRAGGEAKRKLQKTFSAANKFQVYLILPDQIRRPQVDFHDVTSIEAVRP